MTDRSVLSTVSMLTMDPADLPIRSDSSESSGTLMQHLPPPGTMLTRAGADGRVHKFQKIGNNGNRLRRPSASNATPTTRPPPTSDARSPMRGRTKVPLGPRERPHDFSKQRYEGALG